ncbi:MAG: aspartate aminotransferase family protein [Candidatus Peregrinibacteria bacterium]
MSSLFSVYPQFPVSFVKASGTRLWDDEGNAYLDFYSGIGCINLGHCHSSVTKALTTQAEKLWHISNIFPHKNTILAAEKLASKAPFAAKVFFANSGAEANEAALKLARKYSKSRKGTDAIEIIAFEKSFHGRTMATLSCTGKPKMREDFSPMLPTVHFAQYNNISSVRSLVSPHISAIIIETIQGEGGLATADFSFLQAVRELCDEHDILLIVDEVQTGAGRTGTFFSCENTGVIPDIITAAKAIGNGFPVGAMLAKPEIAKYFAVGDHGTTFGGNPMATAVVSAVCDEMTPEFLTKVQKKSEFFDVLLQDLQTTFPEKILELRGRGFMRGILFPGGMAPEIQKILLLENRLVTLLSGDSTVLRLLPPLVSSEEELQEGVLRIREVVKNV